MGKLGHFLMVSWHTPDPLIIVGNRGFVKRNTIQKIQNTWWTRHVTNIPGVIYLQEILETMLLSIQRKGKKVLMNEEELQEYMSLKLNELAGLVSNITIALIMTSLLVVFNFLKAKDIYFYALIFIPLVARWYIVGMVNKWLRNKFKELLYT